MKKELNFLVILDESDEMFDALRYASLRAARVSGKVVLLYTFDKIDFRLRAQRVDLCFKSKIDFINGEVVERRIQELNKALKSHFPEDVENKFKQLREIK